jgi:hypothetical protein
VAPALGWAGNDFVWLLLSIQLLRPRCEHAELAVVVRMGAQDFSLVPAGQAFLQPLHEVIEQAFFVLVAGRHCAGF